MADQGGRSPGEGRPRQARGARRDERRIARPQERARVLLVGSSDWAITTAASSSASCLAPSPACTSARMAARSPNLRLRGRLAGGPTGHLLRGLAAVARGRPDSRGRHRRRGPRGGAVFRRLGPARHPVPGLRVGFQSGESFYLAMPYLSWQTVVVGDPLCAPFRGARCSRPTSTRIDPATELPALFAADACRCWCSQPRRKRRRLSCAPRRGRRRTTGLAW